MQKAQVKPIFLNNLSFMDNRETKNDCATYYDAVYRRLILTTDGDNKRNFDQGQIEL